MLSTVQLHKETANPWGWYTLGGKKGLFGIYGENTDLWTVTFSFSSSRKVANKFKVACKVSCQVSSVPCFPGKDVILIYMTIWAQMQKHLC